MCASISHETKPPYGGFQTFWNFIALQLAEGPLPQLLDHHVMGSRGGSARTELYVALRFFGLVDSEKRPTNRLRGLVSDPSPSAFRPIVEDAYAPVIALGLDTATPSQVDEQLNELGSTQSTTHRARVFFIKAAEHVGIEIGQTLKNAKAPTRRRSAKKKTNVVKPVEEQTPSDSPAAAPDLPTLVQGLIERLPRDGESWNASEAQQWLEIAKPAFSFAYAFSYEEEGPSS